METKKKALWKIILWKSFKTFAWGMGILLVWIILLKWIPIAFTPTMFFRSTEAYFKGEDTKIYYDWVSYHEISDHIKVAVVASEDQRFPSHIGLDFGAIREAMNENKATGRTRGASTISQQVAKNVFLWQGGGYVRKALEVPLTFLIELIWGKQRILEVYLNIAEMGPQTFGVQAASKRYFRKNAKHLSPQEAALITAVLPSPRKMLIQAPNGLVLWRQGHILRQMQLLGGYSYLQNLRRF
jgi:monofunctional glycosyltransferase